MSRLSSQVLFGHEHRSEPEKFLTRLRHPQRLFKKKKNPKLVQKVTTTSFITSLEHIDLNEKGGCFLLLLLLLTLDAILSDVPKLKTQPWYPQERERSNEKRTGCCAGFRLRRMELTVNFGNLRQCGD
ncbi:hypothetical protein, no similarity [Geotrichum candidum]|uniref:Uncharacterized protein n=1 Tax=Geotrichum candidum TaxID=1173061 RepID=A0A0J9XF19_GEOCN|nr:hypothetical protein, no similarity [Geotrichum candidum]